MKYNLTNGNVTIYTPPPPAGGALMGYILSILDG